MSERRREDERNRYDDKFRVRLSSVVDYYLLMSMSTAQVEFGNHRQEAFIEKVKEDMTALENTLAECYFNYLSFACLGEAEHAPACCTYRVKGDLDTWDSYDPRPTLAILSHLFHDYSWNSAYGGRAWGKIADFAQQYGKVTNGFFVDHVVDLEHNCGSVFNKSSEAEQSYLKLNISTSYFQRFCTQKTNGNLLLGDMPDFAYQYVSSRVARLVKMYFRVIRDEEPPLIWDGCRAPWSGDLNVTVTWGENVPSELVRSKPPIICEACSEEVHPSNVIHHNHNPYCSHCFHRKYVECPKCGSYHRPDQFRRVVTHSDGSTEKWCNHCVKSYATTCEQCKKTVKSYLAVYVNGKTLCPHCYERCTDPCEQCGDKYAEDDLIYVEDFKGPQQGAWVCQKCKAKYDWNNQFYWSAKDKKDGEGDPFVIEVRIETLRNYQGGDMHWRFLTTYSNGYVENEVHPWKQAHDLYLAYDKDKEYWNRTHQDMELIVFEKVKKAEECHVS